MERIDHAVVDRERNVGHRADFDRVGTVPLAQYMERIFADELAAQKNADGQGLVFASQMASSATTSSYLGESSKRSSQIEAPLVAARRRTETCSISSA